MEQEICIKHKTSDYYLFFHVEQTISVESSNIDQQEVTAANQIEHNSHSMNLHTITPSSTMRPAHESRGASAFLPAEGGCYLCSSRGETALLAWVDCLCLARKD